MRRLVLMRHSMPEAAPGSPARAWPLSAEGRRRCEPLAMRLATYQLGAIVSSVEPKAVETAALVAERLGLRASSAVGLHEHERSQVGWLEAEAFQTAMAAFFARPDDLVWGEETATQARVRFAAAVARTLRSQPAHTTVGIVTHGTVMTLLVAAANQLDPLVFWRRLGLPAYVVLDLPGYQLREIVERVE